MTAVERRTARVLPVNRGGQVLLLFGRDPARPQQSYWFTIGGATEADETLTEAAVRELLEETGIDIDQDQLIGPIDRGTHTFSYDGVDHVNDSTFFAVAIDDVTVTFDGLEGSEVDNIFEARWWDPADLVHGVPLSNPDLPAVARLATDAVDSRRSGTVDSVRDMTAHAFVPEDFDPPTSLVTDQFRLEPLGPQHNDADRAAWMSSVEHIRATPGYPDGRWPPVDGMSSEQNLDDLRRHARHFEERVGFTFTVLDPSDADVIGCVYLYPADSTEHDGSVQSWVRASRADLDGPLADAVAAWIDVAWPWTRPDRYGR